MHRPGWLSRLRPSARTVPATAVAMAVGLYAICVTLLVDERRDAWRDAEKAAANLTSALAQDIGRAFDLYDLSLQAVAHGLRVPGLNELDPELRQMVLFDRSANARHLGFINVLNEAGEVTADSRAKVPRSGNFASRDYFQAQKHELPDQLFIGRPFLTAPDQPASIPLSRRRVNPDGSFAGVVVGSIRLAWFRALFAPLSVGATGTVALLRSDGLILMRLPFNPDDIGRSLPKESPLLAAIGGGVGQISGVEPGDPVRRVYALQRVGDLPLVVTVGLAQDEIIGPWFGKPIGLAAAAGGLCLLSVALVAGLRAAGRRQALAEAATARATAETARFLATMGHELRTPLTSILGFAELLSTEGRLEPEQSGRLAALCSAGAHMRDVINRVLDITRPEALANLPRLQDTDLDAMVAGCRGMIEPVAVAKGLRLSCQVAPDAPKHGVIDPGQVREVLLNLLGNAVKYTATGEVELRMSGTRRMLRFEVLDTGRGVPADKRQRLFREYDRLDERGAVEGSGLGLSTAARLIRGMSGRIGHNDNPGGGSIFWIELPIDGKLPVPAAVPAAWQDDCDGPSLRILLADDTALNREVTGSFLRAAGHTVVEVRDGVEALQQITDNDFDLVLMDMRMPRMNGTETARCIRSLPGARGQIPIIALTADLLAPHLKSYRAAGINRYLAKPFTSGDLLAMVQQAVPSDRVAQPVATLVETPAPLAPVVAQAILPLLDDHVLDQVAAFMSPDHLDAHLHAIADRIRELQGMLSDLVGQTAALDDLVHELQGSAGLLGFVRLAAALRRYEATSQLADQREALVVELIDVAERSQQVLQQRLSAAGEVGVRT